MVGGGGPSGYRLLLLPQEGVPGEPAGFPGVGGFFGSPPTAAVRCGRSEVILARSASVPANIIVSWRTSQPYGVSGVVYIVRRLLDGGLVSLLATVGEKSFTDSAVPAGTHTVAYTVQCKRGAKVSPLSESLTLRFGRAGGGGGMTATVRQQEPKLAA